MTRSREKLLERADQLEAPENLEERFAPYRDDPVAFVEEQLGATPTAYQKEILPACHREDRVAWRAGHGVGKTTTLSWVLLWWLLTRPFSRVLIVAPAFERQVGRYLLPEVRKWVRRADDLPVEVHANTVEVEGFSREWFALGVQASDPEKVEGGHAESLCVLADEAKGLPADVVAALHGTQTDVSGDRLYMLASVPGGPSGPFYDAFRSGVWEGFHTSAVESQLVADSWVEQRRDEWGEASPLYIARVLGEFPEEDEGTLFRLSDLEAAVDREPDEDGTLAFGLDVARYGADRTVLAAWRGTSLVSLETRQGWDTMEVASWVASEINRHRPALAVVDEIGMGSGVVDRLNQLDHDDVVVGLNVGASADEKDLFDNLRAEIAWRFREALERGEVSLPDHDGLLAELSALRFNYSPRGKIRLEKKEATKRRIGHSPDLADATVLGFPHYAVEGGGAAPELPEEEVAWDPSGMMAPGGFFSPDDGRQIHDPHHGRRWNWED